MNKGKINPELVRKVFYEDLLCSEVKFKSKEDWFKIIKSRGVNAQKFWQLFSKVATVQTKGNAKMFGFFTPLHINRITNFIEDFRKSKREAYKMKNIKDEQKVDKIQEAINLLKSEGYIIKRKVVTYEDV